MKKLESTNPQDQEELNQGNLPVYVPPKIVTYSSEELLEQVGPALTCSPSPCPMESPQPGSKRLPKY
jgi:hypothetical protein